MAKRGRPKKSGKRTKSGRLSRSIAATYDRGTEHAQAIQALYGQDGCDAIGRAYQSGLLGDGQDAKAMLDTARRIAKAYWSAYEIGGYFNPLADRTGGGNAPMCPEKAREREEWLNRSLDSLNRLGRLQRRYFDALVIDVHPDHGPTWLDALTFAHRTPRAMIDPADASALELALEGLAMLARVDAPRVVRLKAA